MTVLPATLLMGGVFPLTVRVATGGLDSVGHDVGNAYALNTLGAIVGSFLAGFVVLPGLGLEQGIYAAVLVDLALAALLFLVAPQLSLRRRQAGVAAAVALALLGLADAALGPGQLLVGFFRVSIAAGRTSRASATSALAVAGAGLLRGRHGSTTVSVERWDKTYSLKNNGKVDASNDADMPTQIMVGLLPLLFYHQPQLAARRALVGYGSGVTAGAIDPVPDRVARRGRARARRLPRPRASSTTSTTAPLQNPKVTARVGDGRNFLTQRERQVRRHRQRAVEPVDDRRLEPVHARVLPAVKRRLRRRRRLLPVGAALRDVALEHARPSTAPCATSSPTSTCSPPRTCRRTPS